MVVGRVNRAKGVDSVAANSAAFTSHQAAVVVRVRRNGTRTSNFLTILPRSLTSQIATNKPMDNFEHRDWKLRFIFRAGLADAK